MIKKLKYLIFIIFWTISNAIFSQNVSLFKQFNGQYDFTFIGNTLNKIENNNIEGLPRPPCEILTSSSANLNLNADNVLEKAYLYWAGSGTGDFNVKLNNEEIVPDRKFSIINSANLPCFSAFKDITNLVQIFGNGDYTLSDFDLSNVIAPYCNRGGNFGGWAIVVVYKNSLLQLNQLNVYDGLQSVPSILNITLNSLNVIDNIGAKIGFVAWEGDKNIQENETLRINGNILSNTLNPANNAFNGTNTVTGSDQLFNMDLDIYDIQNNINIGDSSAEIALTSDQDFVMINVIITKLNSQLPDATISFNNTQQTCNSRQIKADYVVSNLNSTEELPANTPIAIYANNILVGTAFTTTIIPTGGSILGQVLFAIPSSIPNNFILKFVVDYSEIVTEIIETNNTFSQNFSFYVVPNYNILPNLNVCQDVLTNAYFDFTNYSNIVKIVATDIVQFFETYQNAFDNLSPISNINNYFLSQSTKTIYVRIENANCFSITSFSINLILNPKYNILDDLFVCKQNENSSFDFSDYRNLVKINPTDSVNFFNNLDNANANTLAITNINNYIPITNNEEIFVRIDNGICFKTTSFNLKYYDLPKLNLLPNIESCNKGLTSGSFDFSDYLNNAKINTTDIVTFYATENEAETSKNRIFNSSNYLSETTPKQIFVRIENSNFCYDITSFTLITKRCPITIYNAISPNGDDKNDFFYIAGLRDIFIDFETEIYNRWGQLVWKGNNNIDDFKGYSNVGLHLDNKLLPAGTYFYLLNLNDIDYPKPYNGYLYLTN